MTIYQYRWFDSLVVDLLVSVHNTVLGQMFPQADRPWYVQLLQGFLVCLQWSARSDKSPCVEVLSPVRIHSPCRYSRRWSRSWQCHRHHPLPVTPVDWSSHCWFLLPHRALISCTPTFSLQPSKPLSYIHHLLVQPHRLYPPLSHRHTRLTISPTWT